LTKKGSFAPNSQVVLSLNSSDSHKEISRILKYLWTDITYSAATGTTYSPTSIIKCMEQHSQEDQLNEINEDNGISNLFEQEFETKIQNHPLQAPKMESVAADTSDNNNNSNSATKEQVFTILLNLIQKNIVIPIMDEINHISTFKSKTLLLLKNADVILLDISQDGSPYIVFRQNIRDSSQTKFDKNYSIMNRLQSFNKETKLEKNMIDYLLLNKAYAESESKIKEAPAPPSIKPKPELLEMLYNMGFPLELAKKALIETKNGGLDVAIEKILLLQEE
jgi:hypothetical protein